MSYLITIIEILKGLLEVGPKLWKIIKENPAWSIVITILLGILALAYVGASNAVQNADRINTHFPTPEQEASAFKAAQKAIGQINTRLDITRRELNASRVIIYQYHNGQTDLSGLPFTKVSGTYRATQPGVSLDMNGVQNTPLSMWYDLHKVMWANVYEPQCTKIDFRDVENDEMLHKMKEYGVEVLYSCPMVNLTGGPVGQVNVGYLDRDTSRPSDEEIFAELQDVATKTSGYLISARDSVKEDKSWWERILS